MTILKLKKFDNYVMQYSNDLTSFSNRVAIASNENIDYLYFNKVSSNYDLPNNAGIPIIVTENFTPDSIVINETNGFTYNINDIPAIHLVHEGLKDKSFIPKTVLNIQDIKQIKFPVVAKSKNGANEFKTIGKLKASESIYNSFTESPTARTRFEVLSFKNTPISIIERINKYPIDVDLGTFDKLSKIKSIVESVYKNHTNLDFYNLELIESIKGDIYLTGINKKLNLNPHQAKLVYESAYNDYYQTRLPEWVKKQMFSESVVPYYKKKALDAKLVKSKNSINYDKYANI